jgi:hypothetical protein
MVRDVLDQVLRDKNGRECGRVDSVIVHVRSGQPAVATEIECGIFVVMRRVSERLAAWLERLASLQPIPLGSVTFSLDKFSQEGRFIELPVDCEADPRLMRAEKWLRRHMIERIPGGMSAKSK